MFKFLKHLFRDRVITHDKPLLFAHSTLVGFDTLIASKRFVMVLDEYQIPVGIEFFFYLGGGKFIRRKKHDLSGDGIVASMSADLANRIFDHSGNYGDYSEVYSVDQIFTLAFHARRNF
jgi:hypothetical protein